MNKDSPRIIAPEAHHGGQCEGERECEGRKCPHTRVRLGRTTKDSVSVEIECEGKKCPHTQSHTHTFLLVCSETFPKEQQNNPSFRDCCGWFLFTSTLEYLIVIKK